MTTEDEAATEARWLAQQRGQALRALRRFLGLHNSTAARALGLTNGLLSEIEAGQWGELLEGRWPEAENVLRRLAIEQVVPAPRPKPPKPTLFVLTPDPPHRAANRPTLRAPRRS